jgi:hypothetical protein
MKEGPWNSKSYFTKQLLSDCMASSVFDCKTCLLTLWKPKKKIGPLAMESLSMPSRGQIEQSKRYD